MAVIELTVGRYPTDTPNRLCRDRDHTIIAMPMREAQGYHYWKWTVWHDEREMEWPPPWH